MWHSESTPNRICVASKTLLGMGGRLAKEEIMSGQPIVQRISAPHVASNLYPHFEPHFAQDLWTLPKVLEHQARVRGARPFLAWTDTGSYHSYEEVNDMANRLAHGLRAMGVAKGDRVALFLPNSLDFIFTWFALAKLGAVEVAIAESGKGGFLEHQLKISTPKMVITTPELAGRIAEMEAALPWIQTCVLWSADGATGATAPGFHTITTSNFADLDSDNVADPGVAVSPADLATVLFTSGTTGASKGVLMSHAQTYFFAEEVAQLAGLVESDIHMTGFPLIHGNAQLLTVYPILIAGGRCVLYERFSATDFVGRALRTGATVTNLLGATMAFVCAQPPTADDRKLSLKRVYAAPLSPDLEPIFKERFGVNRFVNGFGQTEISLPFMTPPGEPVPPNAVGKLVDQWFEVQLVDTETGRPVAPGGSGELLVRPRASGVISSGYIGMPEKTVEAWRDLWFHTGDVLRCDEQGWYYFLDRVKDTLRRRGENISSFEVEAVVRSHPAVAECAVVAVPADEHGGEAEVKACIVLVSGTSIDFSDLIAWCDARMPYFMVPRYVERLDALPQTPSEKVRKKELRDLGVSPDTWDRVHSGCLLSHERKRNEGSSDGLKASAL